MAVEFKLLRKLKEHKEKENENEADNQVNITEKLDVEVLDTGYKPHILSCIFCILFPVILITLGSVSTLESKPFGNTVIVDILQIVGSPSVALFLGALCSLFLLEKFDLSELSEKGVFGKSLSDCASIILIIGSSGSFGSVLQASGLAAIISNHVNLSNFGILIPILLTACIRSSIGSATVSMITTANIIAPLMPALGLTSEFDKALTVIAVGVGSFCCTHINDSWFWILVKYVNVSLKVMFIALTLGSVVTALSGALIVLLYQYSLIGGLIASGCIFVLYSVFLFSLRFPSCWIRKMTNEDSVLLSGKRDPTYV